MTLCTSLPFVAVAALLTGCSGTVQTQTGATTTHVLTGWFTVCHQPDELVP